MITDRKSSSIALLRMFTDFNLKTWWRSLQGSQFAMILFFGAMMLLIFYQFIQFGVILLRSESMEMIRQLYPWFDKNAYLFVHLMLINTVLTFQFLFTKISRLQITENRKLLALGFPLLYMKRYINLAGFLHPMNLAFHLFWFFYLGSLAGGLVEYLMMLAFIPFIYSLYMTIKWRFRQLFERISGWLSAAGYLFFFILYFVFILRVDRYARLTDEPEVLFAGLMEWTVYSPGALYFLFEGSAVAFFIKIILLVIIVAAAWMFSLELNRQTLFSLKSPMAADKPGKERSWFPVFRKLFGRTGGKNQFYIWSHPYAKAQLFTSLLFPGIFLFLAATIDLEGMGFLVAFFLTMIPVMIMALMMTNIYGFENRELLLSIQFPVRIEDLLFEKIKAAFKVVILFLLVSVLLIPVYYSGALNQLQIAIGIIFIFLFYFNYMLGSAFKNYAKIEKVSLYSLSNPIIPQSTNFFIFITILLFGALIFPVIEAVQQIHILLITAAAGFMGYKVLKRLKILEYNFRQNLIPKLWNEL